MSLFGGNKPTILKDSNNAQSQLAALEAMRTTISPAAKKQLEADIRMVKAGIAGENQVLYELKNSHMEMYVLQDLFLERNGLTAQIDFLVITPQRNFVLECKNLYGDITITDRGDFVRSFGGRKQQGIYSPITQNQRHLELIHDLLRTDRNLAMNLLLDRDFNDSYRSFVVLANPKTVLHAQNANPDVRAKIIRADQLVATIAAVNGEKGPGHDKSARSAVKKRAEWFLAQHRDSPVDYTAKYKAEPMQQAVQPTSARPASEVVPACPRCGAPMVLRTAKKGANSGKRFYGCSTYPKCRGIVNVAE